MVAIARWLPRHHSDHAFDTRFYLANLGNGNVEIEVDTTENRHMFWGQAEQAITLAELGLIKIIYPTRRNLERLALYATFEDCRHHAKAVPATPKTPAIELRMGCVG